MRFYLLLISTFILIQSYGLGTPKDSSKNLRLEPLPSIFHTPETSWGFGVTLLGYIKPKDSLTSKSNFQVFLDATLMNQASFQTDFNFYTAKNKHFIIGSTDLTRFPEFYCGIGNENGPEDYCHIDIKYANLKGTLYGQLKIAST